MKVLCEAPECDQSALFALNIYDPMNDNYESYVVCKTHWIEVRDSTAEDVVVEMRPLS